MSQVQRSNRAHSGTALCTVTRENAQSSTLKESATKPPFRERFVVEAVDTARGSHGLCHHIWRRCHRPW